MVCAMLYNYFPSPFIFAWAVIVSMVRRGQAKASQLLYSLPDHEVQV